MIGDRLRRLRRAFQRLGQIEPRAVTPGPPRNLSLQLGRGTVLCALALGIDRVACAGIDGSIRVLRVSDGTLLHTLEGHPGQVYRLCALGTDRLASGGQDGIVRVWRTDGTLLHVLNVPAPLGRRGPAGPFIHDLRVEGTNRLVAENRGGTVCVWRVADGTLLQVFHNRVKPVRRPKPTPSAQRADELVSVEGGNLRVRQHAHSPWRTLELHRADSAVRVVGTDRIVCLGADGLVRVWTAEGSIVQTFVCGSQVQDLCALGIDRMACASDDGSIRIWRIDDGMLLHVLDGHRGPVCSVCALEADRLASAGEDGTIRIWQADDGRHLHTLEGHDDCFQVICDVGANRIACVRRDGLITGGWDGTIRVWRIDGRLLHEFGARGGECPYVCALGDERLATSEPYDGIRVWRVDGTLLYALEGAAYFSLDDRRRVHALRVDRFASTNEDGLIRIRRTSDGTLMHALEGHRGVVHDVHALGTDRLVSAGSDGTVRVWLERGDTFEPEFVLLPRAGTSVFRFTHAAVRWPIAISRSDRAWESEDPELHEVAAFTAADASQGDDPSAPTYRVPIHAFPDQLGKLWSWSDDRKTLLLAWPSDPEARRVLRRWVFGPRYEQDAATRPRPDAGGVPSDP